MTMFLIGTAFGAGGLSIILLGIWLWSDHSHAAKSLTYDEWLRRMQQDRNSL